MYAVAGATGRVGSATAASLLAAGADARVLVRRRSDAAAWRERGADAGVVALEDREGLGAAIRGCEGVFVLLPFDLSAEDLDAHAELLTSSIAGAVADEHIPHVVLLSSGGADLPAGTGPIAALHRIEEALLATGTTLTALRPGHFQEKVTDVLDLAREHGGYPVFARSADVAHAMVATRDVGAVAAEALLSPPSGSETVDVLGPGYTEREVAAALGAALGRELSVSIVPQRDWSAALTDAGFRPPVAASLAELYRADEQGLLAPRGDRIVRPATTLAETITGLLAA